MYCYNFLIFRGKIEDETCVNGFANQAFTLSSDIALALRYLITPGGQFLMGVSKTSAD
ncbi:hypothetical protein GPUN_0332 [Glaciecola punicea ACAM 611]|uniref:Uncharacterized protein n=1 Tax=Glaciecola punicea ACAM 611 TaxID=1121923 RepID=H5T853_9ALTE|nr:hypothetical protein GPUN_0332 [Glaciecola punicea ACAM 611]